MLGITALASFMIALDALVITTAFTNIRTDFGASVETNDALPPSPPAPAVAA